MTSTLALDNEHLFHLFYSKANSTSVNAIHGNLRGVNKSHQIADYQGYSLVSPRQ